MREQRSGGPAIAAGRRALPFSQFTLQFGSEPRSKQPGVRMTVIPASGGMGSVGRPIPFQVNWNGVPVSVPPPAKPTSDKEGGKD